MDMGNLLWEINNMKGYGLMANLNVSQNLVKMNR
jgi:hypothetical protein